MLFPLDDRPAVAGFYPNKIRVSAGSGRDDRGVVVDRALIGE
jgi:hypothetical protein